MGLPARPENFKNRDRALRNALLASSSLSSRKLFEIEFGHFPPRGLSIPESDVLDRDVHIKSILQDEKIYSAQQKVTLSLTSGGYVYANGQDRTIYLSPLYNSRAAKAIPLTMVAMPVAMISLAAAQGTALLLIASQVVFAGIIRISSQRLSFFKSILAGLFNQHMNTVGHEHIHVLQAEPDLLRETNFSAIEKNFMRQTNRAQKNLLWPKIDSALCLGQREYLMSDHEIQARLHTLAVNGYQRWGRMPVTRHEFWAAMIDCGLKAPRKIRDALAACAPDGNTQDGNTQDNRTQLAAFQRGGLKNAFKRAVHRAGDIAGTEINVAIRAQHKPALRDYFWETTLPYLYGHLLELYGHKTGRSDMGFAPDAHPWADSLPAVRTGP